MILPRGFSFSGLHAGIKAVRKDLALVAAEVPCAAAARVTKNAARAPSIRDLEARLPGSLCAVLVTSGNANALTGDDGARDLARLKGALAARLGCDASLVAMLSTGVLGVRLPVERIVDALPPLVEARGEAIELAAEAILTTDTRPKLASRRVDDARGAYSLAALAKGSGMIAPALATFLAVVVTDARISAERLDRALGHATRRTVERLVIDGEMSTNDAVLVLASGLSDVEISSERDLGRFEAALTEVLHDLSRAVAEDGEGSTKLIRATVSGCPDEELAAELARKIAGSVLVKAAVFGADPNWGRVVATIGAAIGARGLPLDPLAAEVRIQGVTVFAEGAPAPYDQPTLRAKMREPRIAIDVAFSSGPASAEALGCDLGYDYVKINADYASLTTASADGTVKRDDRLTNYTPAFKRALLVEALQYAARFSGKRAVLAAPASVLSDDARLAAFAHEIHLLRSAGLIPVVVPPRGLAEPLVASLCRRGDRAVGLVGSDAGLLSVGCGGEILTRAELVEILLGGGYLPVVSPLAAVADGDPADLRLEDAAAALAIALRAEKLILLGDTPGVLRDGELVSQMSVCGLRDDEPVEHAAYRAVAGGVASAHVIDGRLPHNVIAELFTEKGVGTIIVP